MDSCNGELEDNNANTTTGGTDDQQPEDSTQQQESSSATGAEGASSSTASTATNGPQVVPSSSSSSVVSSITGRPKESGIPGVETGFPEAFFGTVIIGDLIPINKRNWNEIEVTADDAILDAPSQVTPLLIKRHDIFPEKLPKEPEPKRPKRKIRINEMGEEEYYDVVDGDNESDRDSDEEDLAKKDEEKKEDPDDSEEKPEAEVMEIDDPLSSGKENSGPENDDSKTPSKPSAAAGDKQKESSSSSSSATTMLTIGEYYKSSVGNLLLGIGLSRATEWFHRDAIKTLHKAIRKEGELEEYVDEMKRQQASYQASKTANSIFVFPGKKCPHCEFRSDSSVGLELHMSIPHLSNKREYKCNFCTFSSRDPRTTLFHFQSEHHKPCIIEPPPQLYECPTCPYESSQKQKAATHIAKCSKLFDPEKVQYLPDPESEYPAVTPKSITKTDIIVYEATLTKLRQSALNPSIPVPIVPGLPRGLTTQMLHMVQQQLALQAKNRQKQMKLNQHQQQQALAAAAASSSTPQNNHFSGGRQFTFGSGGATLTPVGSNSLKLQPPQLKQGVPTGRMGNFGSGGSQSSKGGQQISGAAKVDAGKSGTFVICEICDGYIKDLEQLRTHMQWIHKVCIYFSDDVSCVLQIY